VEPGKLDLEKEGFIKIGLEKVFELFLYQVV